MNKKEKLKLPTDKVGGVWWGTEQALSQRFVIEYKALRDGLKPSRISLFDVVKQSEGIPVQLKIPPNWYGFEKVEMTTQSLVFEKNTGDFPMVITIVFKIDIDERSWDDNSTWQFLVFIPQNYPFDEPRIATLVNGEEFSAVAFTYRNASYKGKTYSLACVSNHGDGTTSGHNSGYTNIYMHVLRAMDWILYNMKKKGAS